MSISAAFIKRPIGTSLLAIALFLVGAAVWPLLPVAPLPQVDFPTIQVTAKLPGANPEIMASSIAQPADFSQDQSRRFFDFAVVGAVGRLALDRGQ